MNGLNQIVRLNAEAQKKFDDAFKKSTIAPKSNSEKK